MTLGDEATVPGVVALPEGPEADEAAIAAAYKAESATILRHRLALAIAFFIFGAGVFALVEVRYHPDNLRQVLVICGFAMLACVLALAACRVAPMSRHPRVVGVGLSAFLLVFTTWTSAITGDSAERIATYQVCTLCGFAVVLPWGWRAQLLVAAASFAGLALVVSYLHVPGALGYAYAAVASGALTAVAGAYFLDRYRHDAFVHAIQLTRASAAARAEAAINAALLRFGQTLNTYVDQPDLLERLSGLAAETIECEWCAVFIWDEARQAFRLHTALGACAGPVTEAAQIDFGWESLPALGERVRAGEIVEIRDPVCAPFVPVELLHRLHVSRALCVPITLGASIIGVLLPGDSTKSGREGPFSATQWRLAPGLAQIAATALANARLVQHLQAASRLKSEFVSTMSHELRTPLNVITGYTHLLMEGEFDPLTHGQQDTIGRIGRSARELLDLVNATLDLGRLEAGREVVAHEPVDLDAVGAEVVRELEAVAADGVALRWRNAVAPGSIASDPMKIKTIMKNLVGNALKFTSTGSVTVDTYPRDGVLVLVVRDTGIGIPADQLPVVFEMFRQVDASYTRRFGGVGLGLHIVKRLVDLLGGTVTVESAPGAGSTFTVVLPARAVAVERVTGT
jgi:signal transduction histidine kinase